MTANEFCSLQQCRNYGCPKLRRAGDLCTNVNPPRKPGAVKRGTECDIQVPRWSVKDCRAKNCDFLGTEEHINGGRCCLFGKNSIMPGTLTRCLQDPEMSPEELLDKMPLPQIPGEKEEDEDAPYCYHPRKAPGIKNCPDLCPYKLLEEKVGGDGKRKRQIGRCGFSGGLLGSTAGICHTIILDSGDLMNGSIGLISAAFERRMHPPSPETCGGYCCPDGVYRCEKGETSCPLIKVPFAGLPECPLWRIPARLLPAPVAQIPEKTEKPEDIPAPSGQKEKKPSRKPSQKEKPDPALCETVTITVINATVLAALRKLPDKSVQCIMTSPPYLWLRNYKIPGQIGLEKTPEEFIAILVEVFRECRRVLRDDGTLWLNMGDSYAGSGKGPSKSLNAKNPHSNEAGESANLCGVVPAGYKSRDLLCMPWRLAMALQADGWYLRTDIVWHKPNPMPESNKTRPTRAHEFVFLLAKSGKVQFWTHPVLGGTRKKPQPDYYFVNNQTDEEGDPPENWKNLTYIDDETGKKCKLWSRRNRWQGWKYFYDAEAIREPASDKGNRKSFRGGGVYTEGQSFDNSSPAKNKTRGNTKQEEVGKATYTDLNRSGRGHGPTANKRDVWKIPTTQRKERHFASFPDRLVEEVLKAGSSEGGCCPRCGAPYFRKVRRIASTMNIRVRDGKKGIISDKSGLGVQYQASEDEIAQYGPEEEGTCETLGWAPTCDCDAGDPIPCTVMDPFCGRGTVLVVGRRLGRSGIGIDLNPDYCQMVKKNLVAENDEEGIPPMEFALCEGDAEPEISKPAEARKGQVTLGLFNDFEEAPCNDAATLQKEEPEACRECEASEHCRTHDPRAGCITAAMEKQPPEKKVARESCVGCMHHNCGPDKKPGGPCLHPEEGIPGFYNRPMRECYTKKPRKNARPPDAGTGGGPQPIQKGTCGTCGHHKGRKTFHESCPRLGELLFKGGTKSAKVLMQETERESCGHWISKEKFSIPAYCRGCRYDNTGANRTSDQSACLHPDEGLPGFYDKPGRMCYTPKKSASKKSKTKEEPES